MRKKFLGALLLGAMTFAATSTMVSCKDYDGDISSLKSDLESLNTTVTQKIAALQTADQNLTKQLETANQSHATKTELDQVKNDLTTAYLKAVKEGDDAQAAALKKAQTDLEAAYKAADQSLQDQIDALNAVSATHATKAELDAAVAALNKAITDKAAEEEAALNKAVAAIQGQIDAINAKIDEANANHATKTELANVKSELESAIQTARQELAEQIALVDAKADANKALIDETVQKLASETAAREAKDAELVAADAQLTIAINQAQKAADAAAALAESLYEQSVANLNEAVANVTAAYTAAIKAGDDALAKQLEEAKADLQKQITENADAIKANKDAIEKVSNDLATTNATLATVSDKVDSICGVTAGLQVQLDMQKKALEADSIALVNAKAELKSDIATAKAEAIADATAKVNALAAKVKADSTAIMEFVNSAVVDLTKKIGDNATDIKQLREDYEEYVKSNNATIEKIEAQVEKNTADIEALNAQLDALSVMTAALAKDLRGLVFMPYLYVDGIEAVNYPYVGYNSMKAAAAWKFQRAVMRDGEQVAPEIQVPAGGDFEETTTACVYGPEIAVDYHMNPANAGVTYADVQTNYIDRPVEIASRSAINAGTGNVVKAEKNSVSGAQLFANNNGILTVGLKVNDPSKVTANNTIFALQVNSKSEAGNDTLITSDYALLNLSKYTLDGIVWTQENDRLAAGSDPWDEVCPANGANKHIFDNPEEALKADPSLLVQYDGEGVDLSEFIGTHYACASNTKSNTTCGTWAYGDEKTYGLHYEFALVNYTYTADGKVQIDSKYANLNGSVVKGQSYDGKAATETTIGREPLVQVKLMQGDKVVKDAYILIRFIEKKHVDAVEDMESFEGTFDDCNALTFNTPADKAGNFSEVIIAGLLNGEYDFDTLESLYAFDTNADGTLTVYKDSTNDQKGPSKYEYTLPDGTKDQVAAVKFTNVQKDGKDYSKTFTITFSEDQAEAFSHDKGDAATGTLWVRMHSKSIRAPYQHIWVKFGVTINRTLKTAYVADKIDQYWYGLDGASTGWDVVSNNVMVPTNNKTAEYDADGSIRSWSNSTRANFAENLPYLSDGNKNYKYFFVPQNTKITDLEGNTWVITPQADETSDYNILYCEKYINSDEHFWPLAGVDQNGVATTEKSATNLSELKKIMKECSIKYNAGAFNNTKLYAAMVNPKTGMIDPADLVEIAMLNPTTGQVSLVRSTEDDADYAGKKWTGSTVTCADNQPLDMILNAVGWKSNYADIAKQFHAWIGIVADNGCGVAEYTFEKNGKETDENFGIFAESWWRPININNIEPVDVQDYMENGNFIPVYKLLSFYDWRGTEKGEMESAEHKWFWAYYNINRVEVDVDPDHVTTNLKTTTITGELGKTPLSKFTGMLNLKVATAPRLAQVLDDESYVFSFDLPGLGYNKAGKSAELLEYLTTGAGKNKLGYIYYKNNLQGVDPFQLRIPVTVYYAWGHFKTYVDVTVGKTQQD